MVTAMVTTAKIAAAGLRMRGVPVIMGLVRMVWMRLRRLGAGRGVLVSGGARQPEPEAAGGIGLIMVLAWLPAAPMIHPAPQRAPAQEEGNEYDCEQDSPQDDQAGEHHFDHDMDVF